MADKIVQVNLNGQRDSTDLFLQYMREHRVSLAAVSEPHSIPDDPGWAASTDARAAVTWRGSVGNLECAVVTAGIGFCIVSWGAAYICSCYFSPNTTDEMFGDWLNNLGQVLSPYRNSPVLILGDFNARSRVWDLGTPNGKGDVLMEWMAGLDFVLLNRGWIPTTFHARGQFVVDTSWANPAAESWIRSWRVDMHAEILSDHRPIIIGLGRSKEQNRRRIRASKRFPRWSINRLDVDKLEAGALGASWASIPEAFGAERFTSRLVEILEEVCNCAMPRAALSGGNTRPLYWWNEGIARLRAECVRARRTLWRRRKRAPQEAILEMRANLRRARRELRREIGRSKRLAWRELLNTLESDPWGRPYRVVLKRVRAPVAPVCEVLAPEFLDRIVGSLFPIRIEGSEMVPATPDWDPTWDVTSDEVMVAIRRMSTGKRPLARMGFQAL